MKLRLLILLAAALAASPAAGQTVKSLGYNTTNGNIVAATNVTFTNSVGFATNARAATRTNLGGTTVGNAVFVATNAAAARSAIGAGTVNEGGEPSFESVTANLFTAESINEATGGLQALDLLNFSLTFGTNYVLEWSATDVQLNKPLTFFGTNTASTTRTNLGLGATNNVTFSNIAASGTLTATGNATLSGVNNTMPNATNAASASSLMTRDLVGQEFANPRTKMQTTYWFGLEGLGFWQAVNSAVAVAAHRGPRFGASLGFYASSRSAVSAAGAGLRLGSTAVTGSGAWAPVDGGAFTMQTQVVNYYAPPFANLAFGFFMGSGDNTNFWGSSNSVGLYCVQQPTNSWVSNAVVTQHSRIAVSNVVWIVSTAGTNDATGPTWTDLIGSLVTNGSAVYRNLGPHTSNNWVLATGGTNASQIVMTNTGKSNWMIPSQGEAVLKLRYGTNTSAPFTFFATVTDGAGESAEVSLATPTNSARLNPQYWLRHDSTNAALGNDAAGIRYFAIDATLTPPTSP